MDYPKPKIVVSKCLGFASCRYNKQMIKSQAVEMLKQVVDFIPVCPECEIGLGVPRLPIRVISSNNNLGLVQRTTEKDVTQNMISFMDTFFDKHNDIDGFILKGRSPSCGLKDVKIYPSLEKVPAIAKGSGFFGGRILKEFPYHPIEDDGRLNNLAIRESFYTKLFAFTKFKEIENNLKMKDLVAFHSNYKYLFMAYNEKVMRKLGPIVANHDNTDIAEVFSNYKKLMMTIFPDSPKKGSYINVLLHIFGYFKKQLSSNEKSFFLEKINLLSQRKISLSICLNLLESWIHRFDNKYLISQAIFKPFPEELMDISDNSK